MPNRTPSTNADKLRAAAANGDLDDQPTQPASGPGAIVKADPRRNGRSATDIAYGDFIQIVRHAERLVFDGQTALQIQAELDSARRQMQTRNHVDLETRKAVLRLAEAWVVQDDDGGEGS